MLFEIPARWQLRLAIFAVGLGLATPGACAEDCSKLYLEVAETKPRGGNPFLSASAEGLSRKDLQWYALDALLHDEQLPVGLRQEAASKAAWFTRPTGTERWNAVWQVASPADRAQAAAEFALTAFNDTGTDGNFRAQLLRDPARIQFNCSCLSPPARALRTPRNCARLLMPSSGSQPVSALTQPAT